MIQGSRISKNEGGLSQFQKYLLETTNTSYCKNLHYCSKVAFEETPQEVLLHWLRLFLYNVTKFVKAWKVPTTFHENGYYM